MRYHLFIQSTIDYIAALKINEAYGDMLPLIEMTAEEAVEYGMIDKVITLDDNK